MPGGLYFESYNKTTYSVAKGAPTTIDLPLDRGLIHELHTVMTEGAVSAYVAVVDMPEFCPRQELLIDGEVFGEYHTPDLIMINQFYGETLVDGILPMLFAQNSRSTVKERESTSFLASSYRKPALRFYIGETIGVNPIVSPNLEQMVVAEGITQAGRNAIAATPQVGVSRIMKFYRDTIDIKTTGETYNRYRYEGGGERIRAFHFKGSNITAIRILLNEQERWFFPDKTYLNARLGSKGAVPQADWWHIAFETLGGSVNGMLNPKFNGVEDVIDFQIYTNAVADVSLLVEQYNKPQSR